MSTHGPKGLGDYVVRDGDCIASIAFEHGHLWETLWNHPDNAALKAARKDPNILLDGDRVTIPERRPGQRSRPVDDRHRFVRKDAHVELHLRLLEDPLPPEGPADPPPDPVCRGRDVDTEDAAGTPAQAEHRGIANAPYVLTVGARSLHGRTDGQGRLDVSVPPDADAAVLCLHPGTALERRFDLRLGSLAPIAEPLGLKQRLANLSFECGDRDNRETPGLAHALAAFQEQEGLEVSGRCDAPTRARLQELHGS